MIGKVIGRTVAMVVALTFVSIASAWADEPAGTDFPVPRPTAQAPAPVTAPPPPYVAIETTSIGMGIGVSWGDGTLLFEGEEHAFSVKGLSLFDLGVSKLSASGEVRHLDDLSDFAGPYVAIEAGIAAGVGGSVLTMRNQNGVVISLQSALQGVQLTLGTEGISIELE